jgi:benzodiazapine receptor
MKFLRPILILIATILTIVVNALANILPFNGVTTGEISDSFSVYFVPAGYVFAIWGLIYLGLVAFSVYQFIPQRSHFREMNVIGVLYGVSALANSLWIIAWHYGFFAWTMVLMIMLLCSLIGIYVYWGIGIQKVSPITRLLGYFPIQVYLGWISVATVANATVVLYRAGYGFGLAGEVWSAIMIGVVGVLTGVMLVRRNDYIFALVILWSLIGIQVKFIGISVILYTALVVELFILVLMMGVILGKLKKEA